MPSRLSYQRSTCSGGVEWEGAIEHLVKQARNKALVGSGSLKGMDKSGIKSGVVILKGIHQFFMGNHAASDRCTAFRRLGPTVTSGNPKWNGSSRV